MIESEKNWRRRLDMIESETEASLGFRLDQVCRKDE